MRQEGRGVFPMLLVVGGGAGIGVLVWALARSPLRRTGRLVERERVPPSGPRDRNRPRPPYSELDVEAAARMLASENPQGSERLHIEQVWTQLRWTEPGRKRRAKSLYDRITAGSSWGAQGQRKPPGGVRPVATTQPAQRRFRKLVEEVLEGRHPSKLPGATKFFEPAVQDRAFALGEAARKKRAAGGVLSDPEKKYLAYRRNAADKRAQWLAEGAQLVGIVDGIEFFT